MMINGPQPLHLERNLFDRGLFRQRSLSPPLDHQEQCQTHQLQLSTLHILHVYPNTNRYSKNRKLIRACSAARNPSFQANCKTRTKFYSKRGVRTLSHHHSKNHGTFIYLRTQEWIGDSSSRRFTPLLRDAGN
jgi:hypothetical protein